MKTKTKKKEKTYQLLVTIAGETLTFDTDDFAKTLLNFTTEPYSIKSKVLFKFIKGEKSFEKMVLPRVARRYFKSPPFAQIFARNMANMLN